MALTDREIRAASPKEKPYRLFDARGLYLEVTPSGGRLWRLKYRYGGKEKRLALGAYPDVSLKDARTASDAARVELRAGHDPGAARQAAKAAQRRRATEEAETFKAVAEEWRAKVRESWSAGHAATVEDRLTKDVYPWLGARPVAGLQSDEVLATLRRIEDRGAPEVARRVRQIIGQVTAYAVATGRATRNPVPDLRGALIPPPKRSFAALTKPKDVGALLRAIDGYSGSFVVRCALKLAPLTFVRPGELRHAEWSEIDLDAAEWRIPAGKMKAGVAHLVPLSRQAIEVLRDLQPLTGTGRYLFPSVRGPSRAMSENTVNAALRRLGYTGAEMTGHGFRAMASTLLNEQGWNSDAIERQLAHGERNKVRAAYHRAEYLAERVKMMQAWADYLDGLRADTAGTVVMLRQVG